MSPRYHKCHMISAIRAPELRHIERAKNEQHDRCASGAVHAACCRRSARAIAAAEALHDDEGRGRRLAIRWPTTIPEGRIFVGIDLPHGLPNLPRSTRAA